MTSATLNTEKARRTLWSAVVVGLFLVPMVVPNTYHMHVLNIICLNIILAVGLNIVKGFTGQVTVGHVGLYAVGAYASAALSIYYQLPFWVVLPAAVIITICAGIIIGIPAIRLEGAYLALVTLGFMECVRIILLNSEYFGTSVGLFGIPAPEFFGYSFDTPESYWYLLMPATVIAIYVSFCILKSSVGRAFLALRDDALAASASGIDVNRYKLLAFLISAAYAGVAGAFYAHMAPGFIHPSNFTIVEMVLLLAMIVIGGIGRIWGGVIGAIIVTIVHDLFRAYYQYEYIMFGLLIVLMVAYMPRGLSGLYDTYVRERNFRNLRQARKGERSNAT